MTPNILQMMQYLDADKSALIAKILPFYFDFHWAQEHVLGAVINDPLVMVYALHPELANTIDKYVTVVTSGIALGQSIVDGADFWQRPANAKILQQIDAKRAMAYIVGGLLTRDVTTIEKGLITSRQTWSDYHDKKIFSTKIALIALFIVINIVGGHLALYTRLPIYLDTIGTLLGSAFFGPVGGVITGVLTALINGTTGDFVLDLLHAESNYRGLDGWFCVSQV